MRPSKLLRRVLRQVVPKTRAIQEPTANSTIPAFEWYGNFTNLCTFAPIPACNLLAIDATPACGPTDHPFKNIGAIIVSIIGVLIIIRLLWRSHRFFAAVGRTEMGLMLFVYCIISLLQVFTIGGLASQSRLFMMWITAVHLALTTCFFWLLLYNAFALYQIVDDGSKNVVYFLLGSCSALSAAVVVLSMKMALDPGKQSPDHSPALFFFNVVFPLATIMLYLVLIVVLVYKSLDERKALVWVALAIVFFASSQLIVFSASYKLCMVTDGRINGSMFALLLDIAAVSSIYKFWNTVTDDTWGDCAF